MRQRDRGNDNAVSPAVRPSRLRTGFGLFSSAVALTGMAMLVAGVGTTAASAGPAISSPVTAGTPGGCSVSLRFTATTVTAVPSAACTGTDYWLESWNAQNDILGKNGPQTLYASTNKAPWTIGLPPCYWQVDFVYRTTTPGSAIGTHKNIAYKLGGSACSTGTTTTTTVAPTTTTTTVAPTTTTTASTTSTTAPTAVATTVPGVSQHTAPLGASTTTIGTAGPAPATSQGTAPLAFTGSNTGPLLAWAFVFFGVGGAVVGLSRRGRPATVKSDDHS
jgi:hypothetical protein